MNALKNFPSAPNAGAGLYEQFAQSLDESVVWREALAPRGLLLGEGAHFATYLMPSHGPLPLVIKIARSCFLDGLPSERKAWKDALHMVVKLALPMVPPMRVFEREGKLVLVMPYCGESIEEMTGSLRMQDKALRAGLAQAQLEIHDVLQLRAFNGAPYVCDWSDLRRRAY